MPLRNNKWARTGFILILVLLCVAGYVDSAGTKTGLADVGRQDPFTQIDSLSDTTEKSIDIVPVYGRRKKPSDLSEAAIQKPQLYMETVMLRFLRAANLEPVVRTMVTDWGNVAVDAETNSLIISDSQKELAAILEQIRKADRVPRQIQIEVVIVDVKLGDQTEVGVNWENLLANGTQTDFSSKQTLIDDLGEDMTNPGAKLGFAKDGINVSLHALQTTRDTEILANPTVMVVSGQEAIIETVEEIPYTELTQSSGGVGSSDALTSTEFKKVGLTLTVKAIITDENRILMTIEPKQSINTGVAGVGDSTVPIVDTRRTKTTLLMDNNQVLIMGGLRQKETRITKNKIPLLGDLPLVGFLFSSDNIQKLDSELLVFISPHIRDESPLTDIQKNRLQKVKDLPSIEIDTTPRLEHQLMQSAAEAITNIVPPQKPVPQD